MGKLLNMYYFGDTIGGAANAESQAQERALQLGLANRQFAAQQQQQADEIDARNAAAAQQVGMAQWAEQKKSEDEAYQRSLVQEGTKYSRLQHQYELGIGLSEAEKNRQNLQNIYGIRNQNAQDAQAERDQNSAEGKLTKQIESGEINTVPDLSNAENGDLEDPAFHRLITKLGLVQAKNRQAAIMGPTLAARDANEHLTADPTWQAAQQETDPAKSAASKTIALNSIWKRLESMPDYRGKVMIDYANGRFVPKPSLAANYPSDAIDYAWGGVQTQKPMTHRTQSPRVPNKDPDIENILQQRDSGGMSWSEAAAALKNLGAIQ